MRRLTMATVILSGMVALAATPALAEGDPAKGERIFKKCAICHVLEGNKKKPGPSLAGIFGRQAGTFDGFRFSKAMKESGITWTPEALDEFLFNPRKYVAGTKMAFPGLKKAQDREDLIAFLLEATQ